MSADQQSLSHTPGPWHAEGYYVFPAWQAAAAVARVQPSAQAFADARLIAAAPDLLEALALVRRSFGWQTLSDETKGVIDAAISKALGETQ